MQKNNNLFSLYRNKIFHFQSLLKIFSSSLVEVSFLYLLFFLYSSLGSFILTKMNNLNVKDLARITAKKM